MNKASLNNEVILMRKSLKSVLNQTKLNLLKNIKKLQKNEKLSKSVHRKESELEALKRLKLADVNLHEAVNSESQKKILTIPSSSEMERATARILLNPLIQKKVQLWKQQFGPEVVENFLRSNDENILNNKKKSAKKSLQKQKKEMRKADKVKEEESDENENSDDDRQMSDDDNAADSPADDETEIVSKPKKSELKKSKSDKKPEVKREKPNPKPQPKKPREMIKTSDPFFVDSTGSNYLASIEKPDSEAEEYDNERPPKKAFTREKRTDFKKTFNKKSLKPRWNDETPPKPPAKFTRRDERPRETAQVKPSADADIHPSWKAKADQRKQAMAEFQGTKIKFDD